jgi:polyphenol oxidase
MGVPNRVPKQAKLSILRAANLTKIPWLVHEFSTRVGGSSRAYGGQALNLGFTPDDSKAAVERNRPAFSRELTAPSRPWPLISLRQVHSDTIRFVEAPSRSQLVGDGLIPSTPGLLLAIQTADCPPW